jgi:hypothetical protein
MLRQPTCISAYQITEYADRIEAVVSFHPKLDHVQTFETAEDVEENDQWQEEVMQKYRSDKRPIFVRGHGHKRTRIHFDV